eukprot:SAG31_NODE_2909_length_4921_cov_6.411240_4_plen_184_part_00
MAQMRGNAHTWAHLRMRNEKRNRYSSRPGHARPVSAMACSRSTTFCPVPDTDAAAATARCCSSDSRASSLALALMLMQLLPVAEARSWRRRRRARRIAGRVYLLDRAGRRAPPVYCKTSSMHRRAPCTMHAMHRGPSQSQFTGRGTVPLCFLKNNVRGQKDRPPPRGPILNLPQISPNIYSNL